MTERRKRQRNAPAGSYSLVTTERAEALTTELVQLLPAEWKDADVTAAGLEGLRTRDDCKPLLAQITRAVPMRLLVEQGPRSLHRCEKKHLTPSYFFLSVPVEKLGAFVSHRWAADPRTTAQALTMAIMMRNGWLCFMIGTALFLLLLVILPLPVTYSLMPILPYSIVVFLDYRSSPSQWFFSRVLRFHKPWLWFDKVCVHQTERCLNQAGIALFPHYLKKASQLWILFTPEYLTRVWCQAVPTQTHPQAG